MKDENRRIKVKFGLHPQVLACAALGALLGVLAPRGKTLEFASLSEGSIAPARVIAPFDFEVLKGSEELRAERAAAAAASEVVFEGMGDSSGKVADIFGIGQLVSSELSRIGRRELTGIYDTLEEGDDSGGVRLAMVASRIDSATGRRFPPSVWRYLVGLHLASPKGDDRLARFFDQIDRSLRTLGQAGIVERRDWDPDRSEGRALIRRGIEEWEIPLKAVVPVKSPMERLLSALHGLFTSLPDSDAAAEAAEAILETMLLPDLRYDAETTEARRKAAMARVPLAKGFVKRDELIIDSHIRVTREHLEKLHSLAVKRAEMVLERGGVLARLPLVGTLLMGGLIVTLFAQFLIRVRLPVWQDVKRSGLAVMLLAVAFLVQALVLQRLEASPYLVPAAVTTLLIAILIDRATALGAAVALALGSGLIAGNDFQYVLITASAGIVPVIALGTVQHRRDLIRIGVPLALVYLAIVPAFHIITGGAGGSLLGGLGAGLVSAALSPILVLGLVPLCEGLFRITTDLRLLELVDLNQPLLRQLAIKSPGTYHHSLMVGSLAEAGARAIGANSLLTRAGAYYHDIGKMEIGEYFIENQATGSENIHDRLAPEDSARIVIDHVHRGLRLATEHRLPPEVTAFITEHHGTTRLAYFLAKAGRDGRPGVDSGAFRYPGPKPRSRETSILMLADAIEAATRSLTAPSPEEIRSTIDRLVRMRLTEGDLDECPLTLREIELVKSEFHKVLTGIHHQRVVYPEPPGGATDDGTNEKLKNSSLPSPMNGDVSTSDRAISGRASEEEENR